MYINKYISEEEYKTSIKKTIQVAAPEKKSIYSSDYYLEEIRKQIIREYGENVLYAGGLSVRSSLDTSTQSIADLSLKTGLLEYDKRNGYRGVVDNNKNKSWFKKYIEKDQPHNFFLAKVIKFDELKGSVDIEILKGKDIVRGHLLNFNWARKSLGNGYLGPKINKPNEVLSLDDIIYVSFNNENFYNLEQTPKINGAIIVMDPHTGRVYD
jgi:penicillin-binding protein 1A